MQNTYNLLILCYSFNMKNYEKLQQFLKIKSSEFKLLWVPYCVISLNKKISAVMTILFLNVFINVCSSFSFEVILLVLCQISFE